MTSKVSAHTPVVQTTSSLVQVRARRRQSGSARWRLLFGWSTVVLIPWGLQVRSFIFLALPHSIPPELVVPSASKTDNEQVFKSDLEQLCPVHGLQIAGVWWNVSPTSYASLTHWNSSATISRDDSTSHPNADVICRFVVAQYNIHGAYRLLQREASTSSTIAQSSDPLQVKLPPDCEENYLPIVYHFYHGSIGYYAFFEYGEGAYCLHDNTAYVLVKSLGSADLNGRSLTKDNDGTVVNVRAKRWSRWYASLGFVWVSYRVLVVHRSWKLCKFYGILCDSLHETLSLRQALVFVHESARLAAHGATNFQRTGLLYALIESLMTDLFLLIAKDGAGARTQFVSLGYNLACVLSLLFEMLEATRCLGATSRRILRRLFFNVETGFLGELLCALVLQHYLTTLNQSPPIRDSLERGEALSFYVWSLAGHGAIVLGLASFILGVRAIGAMVVSKIVLGSIAAIATPNCVDEAQRGRSKSVIIRGYVRQPDRAELFMTRETLKAFGLLQMKLSYGIASNAGDGECEYNTSIDVQGMNSAIDSHGATSTFLGNPIVLVHPRTRWISTSDVTWDAIGFVISDHVELTKPFEPSGHAIFCNHALGGKELPINR